MLKTLLLLIGGGLAVVACGPRPLPPESPLDTAENHYRIGLERFEQGDLRGAQRQFARARALDPEYPGVLVGDALVAMSQGAYWEGRKALQEAMHQQRDFVDAHLVLGRLAVAEGLERGYAADDWLDEAKAAFKQAAKLAPDDPRPPYYRGQAMLEGGDLVGARQAYTAVVKSNRGPLVAQAMAQIERIQQVERAAPGTRLGARIGLVRQISRGELAVLLLEELKLTALFAQRQGTEPASFSPPGQGQAAKRLPEDIEHDWARPWIEDVLALNIGGLEVFPDGTFKPTAPLTRANYALVNQKILELLSGDASLATRYIGETSRFPDVAADFYAYNAIALNTERGLLQADTQTGRFRPEGPVSGAEALVVIRRLQDIARMEY